MPLKTKVKGLSVETEKVFDAVSKFKCLKDLYLCGGTAISLQIGHRLSEDLDFELIGKGRERPNLSYGEIINEVKEFFPGTEIEILGDDHFQMFLPNHVKLSFFRPENSIPSITEGFVYNNIRTPDIQDMLGMKIFTTTLRSEFRDYYDIYCLLEAGTDFEKGLKYALDFSRHSIHSKSVLLGLTTPGLYQKSSDFDNVYNTKFNISSEEICERIKGEIVKIGNKNKVEKNLTYYPKH